MAIWDTITDLIEAATPWSAAEAEAPPAEQEDVIDSKDKASDEPADEPAAEKEAMGEENAEPVDADEADDTDEAEEDEEEIVDPKEKFENECKEKQCSPLKHHYDECVARVSNASDDEQGKEDCVEEFFHLVHCATQCAAPKLWSALK